MILQIKERSNLIMTTKFDLTKNFNRAEAMLKEKGIGYVREDNILIPGVMERHQIKSTDTDEKGNPKWDFICHSGSYGSEEGLLEYWSLKMTDSGEDPSGWLTAEEVVAKIEAGD